MVLLQILENFGGRELGKLGRRGIGGITGGWNVILPDEVQIYFQSLHTV
jgi:hypothetical protein